MDIEDHTITEAARHGGNHSIRITKQGKMRHWVKHALDFFQDNPENEISLYTSPTDASASTLPKLISVVEIIKREYLTSLGLSSTNLTGLHQHNQLLYEEQSEAVDGDQRFVPYMKITLSIKPLSDLDETTTYQTPEKRRLSKATKARIRKKEKEKGQEA
ncbi:hypothetical protein BJ138DRAFT_1004665 [Hygrophoropsis aurantiaca]|uniref:Uncharacterized protein n=1 Tax=Hygrophoropsis aurantiaca TaxID=72124 RepID=A0ACB8AGD7_9AGAM|nr:hypothetical protein BJ138DRAFT_1004665 [Hygrophoropsis aurantiaca]